MKLSVKNGAILGIAATGPNMLDITLSEGATVQQTTDNGTLGPAMGTGSPAGGGGNAASGTGGDWTARLLAGNGQDKDRIALKDGWQGIRFQLPSGGYSRAGGGRMNVESMQGQPLDIMVKINDAAVFTQSQNSASIAIGVPGFGDGSPVMGNPGDAVDFLWRPQSLVPGDVALAEVMLPARGSTYT